MSQELSLSLVEIIVLMLGAITLGVTIHFFFTSRKSLREATTEMSGKTGRELGEWKSKYFNETELRDKELIALRQQLADVAENNNIYAIEAEETKKLNRKLKEELEQLADAAENNNINAIEAEETKKLNRKLKEEIEQLKKQLPVVEEGSGKIDLELGEWKSKYFNETELRDKELIALRQQLADAEENNNINAIEAEETKKLNRILKEELEQLRKHPPALEGSVKPGSYTEQLNQAQTNLIEHSRKINELLGQIDIVKETEEKQKEILKYNEELNSEIDELRSRLTQKEKEVNTIRQKENLTKEMSSMLDNAYTEFNVLQDRIKKLEGHVANSKMASLEFEDIKESNYRLNREYEEQKLKYNAATSENRELKELLADVEDELKEANFQRQQLQKRVALLEDMNSDMLEVTDTNKKLEGQLKRIGELESMLNIMAEEREQLEGQRTQQHLKTG
jgi:hypothetical protein